MMDENSIDSLLVMIVQFIDAHIFNLPNLLQIAAIIAMFFAAKLLAESVHKAIGSGRLLPSWLEQAQEWLVTMTVPALWLLLQAGLYLLFILPGLPVNLISLSLSLAAAWLAIHFIVTPIKNKFLERTVATVIWAITALSILGLLDQTVLVLEAAAIDVGQDKSLSLMALLRGVTVLVLLIWLAVVTTGLIDRRISKVSALTDSARVLITKLTRIVLIALAALIGLTSAGLDLTVFAVVGGAIGLGIGFGLQKVVSNLFSGFILLLDRSIKPGDVIEIQGTYGSINRLAARYTSIITRDGTEFLVPNEDMITQPVVNWSHTNQLIRIHVGIGIAYDSDVYKAREIMAEVAAGTDRVLASPAPVCHLMEFADNSLNLDLRFWIRDPQNGIANVSSAVRLGVWEKFNEAGISIPFPQRDVRIISDKVVAETPNA